MYKNLGVKVTVDLKNYNCKNAFIGGKFMKMCFFGIEFRKNTKYKNIQE